ncbi:alpha/beta-hydrolase [Pleomassaria siparia CBS 279.74]|uniref:Carboxylic ester hydrolase n=1 Tax=Pleomassaria siparia CBS 279.74 TaxID=1314801 RepID=A0A6G1K3K4_9PLEO|nr:alpha/beta-hydrolase [Pleomassaria siparia CBS 279.74]
MDGCAFEQSVLIQQNIDTPPSPPMSGLESLNLNITVPDIENRKPLPVMVFIHGGGYMMGANYWPHYDMTRLVKLSVEVGLPVIGININYRLGVLGNLTSEELRKAGYPGNNSLRDQKCALQWIQKHIAGFGGDSSELTVLGESAGAVSVLNQLFSKEPLFKRAISMSGTPVMLKPLPLPVTEMAYGMIIKELGLENASVAERIERLLTIDPDELVTKTPFTVPLVPFIDGDIVPFATTFEGLNSATSTVPGFKWCTELMIGDSKHDGTVDAFKGISARKAGIASAFRISLTKNLSRPTAAEAILKAYDITTSNSDDTALKNILAFANDIAYYAPAQAFARSWPGNAYYYHFDEPNPWDGAFKGYATHLLDAAFLFQGYNEKMSPETREVAISLAKDFVKFANGEVPWRQFDKEKGGLKRFGPSETVASTYVEGNSWGEGRRDTLFKLKKEGVIDLDELSKAWDAFIAGQ